MKFGILGPLVVTGEGEERPIPPGRQRTLLGILLLNARRTVAAERLIDLLWPEAPPEHPANALQGVVSQLRRSLPAENRGLLAWRGAGYCLNVEPESIDSNRFRQLAAEARDLAATGDLQVASLRFATALSLWRGEALEDSGGASWAFAEASALAEARLSVLEDRFEAELALGNHHEVISEMAEVVGTNPLRERVRGQLMRALYRDGRQAESLATFQEYRTQLAEELGIDPGRELQELERQVLQQSPELEWVPQSDEIAPNVPAVSPGRVEEFRDVVIGREEEMRLMRTAWGRTAAGSGAIVLVAGEPGAGKSHLLTALASDVRRQGGHVRWGHCLDAEGTPPFWPWIEITRDLCDQHDHDVLRDALGAGIAEVAQLVPELRHRLGAAGEAPTHADATQARFHLYDSIARFLRRLSARSPILLLLEDIHWADQPTLDLLCMLATHLHDAPLMVVASYRDTEIGTPSPLGESIGRLVREPTVKQIRIVGLTSSQVAELCAHHGTELDDEDAINAVHERSAGNPFFALELAKLIRSEDDLRHDVRWDIPAGVREVIKRRISALPDATIPVLNVGAAEGQEFRISTVRRALNIEPVDVMNALEPAVAAGIIVPGDESLSAGRFAHALIRDTLYAGLAVVERVRIHAALAEAIQETNDSRRISQVAYHYTQAASLGLTGQAVEACLQAADEALAILAFEQAEAHLRAALDTIERHDGGVELEFRVQSRLAFLLVQTGGWSSEGSRKAAERARVLARQVGDTPEVAGLLWALCSNSFVAADYDAAERLAHQLIELEQPVARAAGLQARGTLNFTRGHPLEAVGDLEASIAIANSTDAEHFTRAGLSHIPVWSRSNIAHPLWAIGRRDDAERYLEQATTLSDIHGHPFERAYPLIFRAWLHSLEGDAQEALVHAREAMELCDQFGFPQLGVLARVLAGWATARTGVPDVGVDLIEDALRVAIDVHLLMLRPFHLALFADALVAEGRPEEALERLEEGIQSASRYGEPFHLPELLRMKAEIIRNEHADGARALIAEARKLAEAMGATAVLGRLANV